MPPRLMLRYLRWLGVIRRHALRRFLRLRMRRDVVRTAGRSLMGLMGLGRMRAMMRHRFVRCRERTEQHQR
jgi:hypothetical protein